MEDGIQFQDMSENRDEPNSVSSSSTPPPVVDLLAQESASKVCNLEEKEIIVAEISDDLPNGKSVENETVIETCEKTSGKRSEQVPDKCENGEDITEPKNGDSEKNDPLSEGKAKENAQDANVSPDGVVDEGSPVLQDMDGLNNTMSNLGEVCENTKKYQHSIKNVSSPNEWLQLNEIQDDNGVPHPFESGESRAASKVGAEGLSTENDSKINRNPKNSEEEKIGNNRTKDGERPRSRSYPFKILVSGLPLNARRDEVMSYFSQFGEVLKLWDEGRHRANVLYADEESFKKAVFASDPHFDDHKLSIRSLNESVSVISGIPQSLPAKEAEKSIKSILEEAGALPSRVHVPLNDSLDAKENNTILGHAYLAFSDSQILLKAEDKQNSKPFVIADNPVVLHSSCNDFYEKFCVRVFPLPCTVQRSVLYQNLHASFAHFADVVSIVCQYVGNATAYAGYILFKSEESVKKARELGEIKVLADLAQIQEFHPFEQGQGFRHLWLKVINLPPRITITEIKHHFGHDRGILNVQLDLDFGSCFIHVNSEATLTRCLQLHQTYVRGKCIAVLIAEENPDRTYYREISRRGRKPNYRNVNSRKKTANNSSSGFNGKTYTSGNQSQGNQDRRSFERGDRKFSKTRSSNIKGEESLKTVKEDGDGVHVTNSSTK